MFTDVIILAGGFGERLWPASKPDFPKQFMALEEGVSFFQHSVLRALALEPVGKIIVATRKGLEKQISMQIKALYAIISSAQKQKLQNDLIIFAEPSQKHTTAPILASSYLVKFLSPDIEHTLLVLTSDHIISPTEEFINSCKNAFDAVTDGYVVTFGIPPYEPATGYGYIIFDNSLDEKNTYQKILKFTEKPERDTAEKYIAQKNCLWNSGMYAFSSEVLENELKEKSPEVFDSFFEVANGNAPKISFVDDFFAVTEWNELSVSYEKVPSIAIDKSVAEKTKNAAVVKASFNWDDVGSWDSFEKNFSEKTLNAKLIESENCFVYSDLPVAICGVDDITVVVKNGKVLIMKKGESALVRKASKDW